MNECGNNIGWLREHDTRHVPSTNIKFGIINVYQPKLNRQRQDNKYNHNNNKDDDKN